MLPLSVLLLTLIVIFFFLLRSSSAREKLIKLKPSNNLIGYTGCYVLITAALLSYIHKGLIYWYTLQFAAGIWLIGYATVSKKEVPSCEVTRLWLMGVLFCFPINLLWHWWRLTDYPFLLKLSLAHLSVALSLFPLSLGIMILAVVLWAILYVFCYLGDLRQVTSEIISLFWYNVLVFIIIIYTKAQIVTYKAHKIKLKNIAKLKQERNYELKLKQIIHHLHINATEGYSARETTFLQGVVEEVVESPLFLEDGPLYKEDWSIIVKKFATWSIFLKQQTKSSLHLPFLPTEIALGALIDQLEIVLDGSVESVPKLMIPQKNVDLTAKIVCDVRQVVHLLVAFILRVVHLDQGETIRIQLNITQLKYHKYCPIKKQSPPELAFPAIAFMVSNADASVGTLPSINMHYEDVIEGVELKLLLNQAIPAWRNMEKGRIERIVRAHYGYLQFPSSKQKCFLLVLPCSVTTIRDEMLTHLIASNSVIPKSEMDASMVVFRKFNDYVCKMCDIPIGMMDEIFLLLRRCYVFRRHVSGQLFYVRAVGIARLVTDWVDYLPEPICAALLYDLIVYTNLSLSYIKANYSLGIFCFVESIVSITDRREMEPSGLYVDNQSDKVVNKDQFFVLCIKLAERLYDLRHAYGYVDKVQVSDMAKETLTVDIVLAKRYLDGDIVEALETAAQDALQMCLEKE